MDFTIYHNPRCGKSRQALQLLRDGGIEPRIVEYLKQPPTTAELDGLCRQLGVAPQALVRFKEQMAHVLGLAPGDARTRAQWLALICTHPILLERPIVVAGGRARLGRPPEAVRELLP